MNTSASPDERANLVIHEMTLDEKIALLHGVGMPTYDPLTPANAFSNRGVGYVVRVPRLGIPGIDMGDAAYGVRASGINGQYSTALHRTSRQQPVGISTQAESSTSTWLSFWVLGHILNNLSINSYNLYF